MRNNFRSSVMRYVDDSVSIGRELWSWFRRPKFSFCFAAQR
jgi:hypothetical protein